MKKYTLIFSCLLTLTTYAGSKKAPQTPFSGAVGFSVSDGNLQDGPSWSITMTGGASATTESAAVAKKLDKLSGIVQAYTRAHKCSFPGESVDLGSYSASGTTKPIEVTGMNGKSYPWTSIAFTNDAALAAKIDLPTGWQKGCHAAWAY